MVALRMMFGSRAIVPTHRHFKTSGFRMISSCYPMLLSHRNNREESGNGFRGCVLKPFGQQSFFSSSPAPTPGPTNKSRSWFLAIGAAMLGIGGASYVYMQTDDGRLKTNEAFEWVEELLGLAPTAPPKLKINNNNITKDSIIVETKGKTERNIIIDNPIDAKCEEKCAEDCIEKKCGDSDCLRKMEREEEMIAKANSELEKALKDVKPKAVEYTESAMKAYCEATDLIKLFMDKVYCAIEEDNLESPRFEEIWCDVYDTALKRCEKVKDALQKGQCAWELLCRLREVVENGKACKYTSCNPLLITAEESLNCAERELVNAKAKMECVQSESRVVEIYRNVVEDFRRDLKAEVDSMIPNEECKSTFTGNECTMAITHAYKKVLRVQKELAQVQIQTSSLSPTSSSINDNQLKQDKVSSSLRSEFERDIIEALKRQATAYQENFDNQLNVLKSEYERKLLQQDKIIEAEKVVELRAKYNKASATLAAIEQGIETRQLLNAKSQKLRKLWSTSNTLYSSVNYAQYHHAPNELAVINKESLLVDFGDDEFTVQMIKSLPESVTNLEDLKQRFFNKLEPSCRKTMIIKNGESFNLIKYALGTLHSFLIVKCDGDQDGKTKINEILDRTGFHLNRGDLLQATITINQLTGLPREIAKDWIQDARAVLETNQTLFTLMTYAASNNVF